MKNRFFAKFDYVLILIVLILISIGVMFIYSSSVNSTGVSVSNAYIKQIIFASIGLILMILTTLYDYRRSESITIYLYGILILLLIYTRIFGHESNGAVSWIGIGDYRIQPSEFGKIIYILYFSDFLKKSENMNQIKRFLFSILILMIPVLLILIQPDLGTASVYIPIFFFMCFMAGIPLIYLAYLLLFGILTIVFAILPVWNAEISSNPLTVITILTDKKLSLILIGSMFLITSLGFIIRKYFHGPKYIFWITYFFSIITLALIFSFAVGKVLKDYQIMRLIIFMNPNKDPLGAGWNIIQSKIAIGSGGAFGQGYLQGTQSHYRFLPEQHTDFIFSILSEEFGFFGGLVIILLYFAIFVKIILLVNKVTNKYGVYIASGILGMFIFHFFINIGMVMGIMPITGIPLLFMSYGGSSLLTAMISIGLIMNINYRKTDSFFIQ